MTNFVYVRIALRECVLYLQFDTVSISTFELSILDSPLFAEGLFGSHSKHLSHKMFLAFPKIFLKLKIHKQYSRTILASPQKF